MDEHGVDVDPTKIQLICNWLVSMTLIDIYSFLGLTNICPRYMLGLSYMSWPLIQVTKGGAKAKFIWSKSQE